MKIINEKIHTRWIQQAESYADREIIRFAHTWADIVEREMQLGKSFESVWRQCRIKAKGKVISKIMERKAENFLILTWQYGEALKKVVRNGQQRENRTYYNNGRGEQVSFRNRSTSS